MSSKDIDAIAIGNIGIDTNVYLPEGYAPAQTEGAFTDNRDSIGQAGGYTSFGYQRLGLRAGFIGYIGDDPLGRWIASALKEAGIETTLFIDPKGTSRSINLMRPDGTRNNFYDGGSHMTLEPDLDACRRMIARAPLVHVHLANWARRLLRDAKAAGATIACDLQDMTTLDDPYRRDFIDAADILFFSATNFSDPRPVADALLRRNPGATVVAGLGARGALLVTRDGVRHFPPVEHERPVVDTNGAGDSLAVGFLTATVLEQRSPEEAIHWGQIAARHACTLKSTIDLITRPELDARLRG